MCHEPDRDFRRCRIFVAQGSTALSGSKKPRASLSLDTDAAVEKLKRFAKVKSPSCNLLRIYWYDGTVGGGKLTGDQAKLANTDDVKLRLGFINSNGQQKGVDSLIVTDLIELARHKSICDCLLLAGDEDLRVGVQIAQNYGVRVHLLGITPCRGSQSHQLMQEADTTSEWEAATVASFLSILNVSPTPSSSDAETPVKQIDQPPGSVSVIDLELLRYAQSFGEADLSKLADFWKSERGLPSEIDKALLAMGRRILCRQLDEGEKRHMRVELSRLVKARFTPQPE